MEKSNQAYKLPLAAIGEDVMIWPRANIIAPEAISIGDSVIVDDFAMIMGGKRTVVGSFVHIAAYALLCGGGELFVEDFAGISGGAQIYTGNEDYMGSCLTGPTVPYPYRKAVRSFVRVGKHAIVGAKTVVLPGVVIGEGTVIGANSTVIKSCEPWGVYVGSPARRIKDRPKERILELEQQLRGDLYDTEGCYISRHLWDDLS